jgi:antitoxin ParD1/3/4
MNNYDLLNSGGPAMSRLTISMPDQMNEWVEAQISAGRYGNVSEYFRDLVRRDQERRENAIRELRTILDRAEQSGVSEHSLPEVLEAARQEARQKGLLLDSD